MTYLHAVYYPPAITTRIEGTLELIDKVSSIYPDVDLNKCKLASVPTVTISIAGKKNHWEASGVNTIYNLTAKGFLIRIHYRNGITPAQAKNWGWEISWLVYPQTN